MLQRCTNPSKKSYAGYGGRGIKVCERWLDSFDAFLADMGPRTSPGHSLDRIDNDGPYSPENCRWATRKEQCRNRRSNRLVIYDGTEMPLVEAAERAGLSYQLAYQRLLRGWTPEEALEVVPRRRPRPSQARLAETEV